MKRLLIIPLLLLSLFSLGGCDADGAQVVVHNNYVVVSPPSDLYKCPTVRVPNTDTLSNQGIVQYVVKQYNANVTCHNSMLAIQKYVAKAKAIYN